MGSYPCQRRGTTSSSRRLLCVGYLVRSREASSGRISRPAYRLAMPASLDSGTRPVSCAGIRRTTPKACRRFSRGPSFASTRGAIARMGSGFGQRLVVGVGQSGGRGIGGHRAAARFEFLAIGALRGFPSFALVAATSAPTGRRVEQTSPPLFAGTTGRGAWSGSLRRRK